MFTIMFWIAKHELRVVERSALYEVGDEIRCDHHSGHPLVFALPPECEALEELPLFEDADAAWSSIRDDYCPSLHP